MAPRKLCNHKKLRLRNLTYSSPLFLEMRKKVLVAKEMAPSEKMEDDDDSVMADGDENKAKNPEYHWSTEEGGDELQPPVRVFIGKMPIMLKSSYCVLKDFQEDFLYGLNECPYDQGGYFHY